MKKQIFIAGLLMVALCSCSNNAKSEAEQPTKTIAVFGVTTEATTEPITTAEITTEAEIPPATETETVSEVIYKDDNVTIVFNKYDNLKTVQRIYLSFENRTENYLRGDKIDFQINGVPIDVNYGIELEPGQNASNHITIVNTKLQDKNITRVNDVQLQMHIETAKTVSDYAIESYDTDIMTITR